MLKTTIRTKMIVAAFVNNKQACSQNQLLIHVVVVAAANAAKVKSTSALDLMSGCSDGSARIAEAVVSSPSLERATRTTFHESVRIFHEKRYLKCQNVIWGIWVIRWIHL